MCLPTVQSLIILHVFSWFLRVSKAVIAMRHGSKEELAPKRPDLAVSYMIRIQPEMNQQQEGSATEGGLCPTIKVMYGGKMGSLPRS